MKRKTLLLALLLVLGLGLFSFLSLASGPSSSAPATKPCPTPTPTPTATPTPTPSPTPTPTPSSLKIITANLAHGEGTDGQFRNPGDYLPDADIVLGQEATAGDLPGWDAAFAARGLTRAVYFPNSTGPNNTGDGQVIYYKSATVTVNGVFTHQLSTGFIGWDGSTNVDKSAAAIDITAGSLSMAVINVHLCWSKCADTQADVDTTGYSAQRVAQINELLSWSANTFPGKKRLIAGDYNLTPSFLMQPSGRQIDLFLVDYVDLWAQAIANGVAVANWGDRDADGFPDMPLAQPRTADTREIDYFMLLKNSGLGVVSVEILDTRALCPHALVPGGNFPACSPEVIKQWDVPEDFGPRPSDHNPLLLTVAW